MISADEIKKAVAQLMAPGSTFECRILQKPKKAISGYFRDANTLLKALAKVDLREANVYVTLQQIDDICFHTAQSERFLAGATATADKDVKNYRWFFIDLDPVRHADVSSSQEELQLAYELAAKVKKYLASLGFSEPLRAVSGNGAHLLYRIKLDNTQENTELLKQCLAALDYLLSTDCVKVDTTVYNPARICKLYGTLAQKGRNTAERPHRLSRLLNDAVIQPAINDVVLLQKLAALAPPEAAPAHAEMSKGYMDFDLEAWLNRNGIAYRKATWKDGEKFVLERCPFDSTHKAPDSSVFRMNSGAIGFRCLHNSCQSKRWPDMRLLFEPDAYQSKAGYEQDRRIEEGWQRHNRTAEPPAEAPQEMTDEPRFLTMGEIYMKKATTEEFIRTGIHTIDRKLKGLQKQNVSVISGLRGAAKSTILGQLALNAVNDGHKVLVYSGELSDKNFLRWLLLQAAGRNHVTRSQKYEDYWTVPDVIKKPIVEWLGKKLLLFNNTHGNNFLKVSTMLRAELAAEQFDLVILDNLMALDLTGLCGSHAGEKNDEQTAFVWALKDMAKKHNVHIIFVAHPRKAIGFLRLNDISGTGNIANIVDTAFVVHRVNEDFKRAYREYFKKDVESILTASNVIEICKDREGGVVDEFIPLYYEKPSKRLLNALDEYVKYGWEDSFEVAQQKAAAAGTNDFIPF